MESFAIRDAFVAGGMEEGVRDGYAKLDALLAGFSRLPELNRP